MKREASLELGREVMEGILRNVTKDPETNDREKNELWYERRLKSYGRFQENGE